MKRGTQKVFGSIWLIVGIVAAAAGSVLLAVGGFCLAYYMFFREDHD